jgi:hypothetical protein
MIYLINICVVNLFDSSPRDDALKADDHSENGRRFDVSPCVIFGQKRSRKLHNERFKSVESAAFRPPNCEFLSDRPCVTLTGGVSCD